MSIGEGRHGARHRLVLVATLVAVVAVATRVTSAQTPGPMQFSAAVLNGDSVRVGQGRVALVNVFATWCTTCKTEFAQLDTLAGTLRPSGIEVLALAVDDAPRTLVLRFAQAHHQAFPIVFDSAGALARRLGIVGVPETFLIAADGRVVWHQRGPIERAAPALQALLQACANSRPLPDPCGAQRQ